jgi:hypothetical protein
MRTYHDIDNVHSPRSSNHVPVQHAVLLQSYFESKTGFKKETSQRRNWLVKLSCFSRL